MDAFSRVRQHFAKPDKNTSLAIMFAGFAVYAIGALFGSRFVAGGGWLISLVAIVNYARWFFSDSGIRPEHGSHGTSDVFHKSLVPGSNRQRVSTC